MSKSTSNIEAENIPQHIAIIMDGNRRWARAKGLSDDEGHQAGARNLERIVNAARDFGVKSVTVYALSTENIKERAKREILGIFRTLQEEYHEGIKRMNQEGVKVNVLGEKSGLPASMRRLVDRIRNTIIKNESIQLNIAFNYGGKRELLEAFKGIIKDGVQVNKINEDTVGRYLYTHGQHDPELVIRTGGRSRLSNFLIWQTAYSEIYFTTKYWPDFGPKDLETAIKWYQSQKRNFGK